MFRGWQKRGRTRQLSSLYLERLAQTLHHVDARPLLPCDHRAQSQKKGRHRTEQLNNSQSRPREPAEPDTPPPAHKRLIALTLAEIRKLLNLNRNDDHAIAHGLQWSTWRRHHQANARRAHVRRHLRLQTLVI